MDSTGAIPSSYSSPASSFRAEEQTENAVLTFREYLNDYASAETRRIGEQLIEKELREIEGMSFFTDKKLLPTFLNYYKRIASGERDLYM